MSFRHRQFSMNTVASVAHPLRAVETESRGSSSSITAYLTQPRRRTGSSQLLELQHFIGK